MFRFTETVKHLIIINVIVFIGTLTLGKSGLFMDLFAMHFPNNSTFKSWQLFTHMFIHGSPNHIFFNMFLFLMFGTNVELAVGKTKFLFLYISCGLGAILLSLIVDYGNFYILFQQISDLKLDISTINEVISSDISDGLYLKGELLYESMEYIFKERNINLNMDSDSFKSLFDMTVLSSKVSFGASGAVMGILAAFVYVFPNMELQLIFLPITIKAKYLIGGMIGSDLIAAFLTGTPLLAGSNVGYLAHVGGALTGFLIMRYWRKNQFNNKRLN